MECPFCKNNVSESDFYLSKRDKKQWACSSCDVAKIPYTAKRQQYEAYDKSLSKFTGLRKLCAAYPQLEYSELVDCFIPAYVGEPIIFFTIYVGGITYTFRHLTVSSCNRLTQALVDKGICVWKDWFVVSDHSGNEVYRSQRAANITKKYGISGVDLTRHKSFVLENADVNPKCRQPLISACGQYVVSVVRDERNK